MTQEERIEKVKDAIECLHDEAKRSVWNEYCHAANYPDDWCFRVEDMDEEFQHCAITDVLNRVFYGDFNPNCEYWQYDGYANIQSIELDDLDWDAVAKHCVENDTDLYESDIRDALDEEDEEGSEEE